MRWRPKGYGGQRRDTEQAKRDSRKEQGLLAVTIDDDRLPWPERELIRHIGEKPGPRLSAKEARHG